MNLKQKLIAKVWAEAAEQAAAIEAHAGLIAEAEALSERLAEHLPKDCSTGRPTITVYRNCIVARIQFDCLERRKINDAIAGAGLRVVGESEPSWDRESTLLHLEGIDVPIHDATPREPIAEAA